jgi:hypothetical protein
MYHLKNNLGANAQLAACFYCPFIDAQQQTFT